MLIIAALYSVNLANNENIIDVNLNMLIMEWKQAFKLTKPDYIFAGFSVKNNLLQTWTGCGDTLTGFLWLSGFKFGRKNH